MHRQQEQVIRVVRLSFLISRPARITNMAMRATKLSNPKLLPETKKLAIEVDRSLKLSKAMLYEKAGRKKIAINRHRRKSRTPRLRQYLAKELFVVSLFRNRYSAIPDIPTKPSVYR
jgi:hypothetical protein